MRRAPYDEDEQWEDPEAEFGEDADEPDERYEKPRPPVISTNLTINLICTLCAASGLLGLFFFFADQHSRAVRRFAVQSVGLLFVMMIASAAMLVVGLIVGWMPLIGMVLTTLLWLLWGLLAILCLVLRVRLMWHAYRGEGYVLPVVGERFRQFE